MTKPDFTFVIVCLQGLQIVLLLCVLVMGLHWSYKFDSRLHDFEVAIDAHQFKARNNYNRQQDSLSEVRGYLGAHFGFPYLRQGTTTLQAGDAKLEVPGTGGIISAGSVFNIGNQTSNPPTSP